jgi:hypothetical protein
MSIKLKKFRKIFISNEMQMGKPSKQTMQNFEEAGEEALRIDALYCIE